MAAVMVEAKALPKAMWSGDALSSLSQRRVESTQLQIHGAANTVILIIIILYKNIFLHPVGKGLVSQFI